MYGLLHGNHFGFFCYHFLSEEYTTKIIQINITKANILNDVIDHRSYIIGCGAFVSVILVGLLLNFTCKAFKR